MTTSIPTGGHWGRYIVDVDKGHIVGVRPVPEDPDPTPLHRGLADIVDHRCRVRRPAIRKDWLEKGQASDRSGRGAGSFVEVEWDEALTLVAGEIDRVRQDHGNASIFAGSYGWASAGRLHHPRTLMKRMLNLVGGFTDHVLDYSRGAALVIVPHVVGTQEPVGMKLTAWDSIIEHADMIVSFGGLSPKNFQIDSGGMGEHLGNRWMSRVAEADIDVVNVGPTRDDTSKVLDAKWIPIRPNTDTAMMLAIAHVLLSEGLHDQAFISRYTVGFDTFSRYLTGEADGVAKTPEWVAPICEIEADAIRDLARRMAVGRTMITLAYALQRAHHGEQSMWVGITLAAMLGQIGLPGGGFGIGYGSMGTKGGRQGPAPLRAMASGDNPTGSYIPVSRISDMLLSPGETIDFNGKRITYPDIRMIMWGGGNPFHHHQDINRLIKAWHRPETIVVLEPFWTPTARHADIVLPVATTLERNDISAGWFDRTVYAMRKAIEPVGDARSDYRIVSELAGRLGCESAFTEGRDEIGWVRHLYDTLVEQTASGGIELPDFDAFWQTGRLELPCDDKPYVMFEAFRLDPDSNPLGTPSGRIEIFSEVIASFGYADCLGHPVWMEPVEWLGSKKTGRFPLHLISNQPARRLHSQNDPSEHSLAGKTAGRETATLNPLDAEQRGLKAGDVARIFNDRGQCLAGIRISDALRPGVVQLPTGAWYDPAEPGQTGTLEIHGNPNVLTIDCGTSSLAQAPISHTALVEVELWTGELPPIKAFDPPAFSSRAPA